MSKTSIDRLFKNTLLWSVFSVILIGWYLSPLFHHTFYVPFYDNLDSNIVWDKILAHSGKIFANNHEIIPNMMDGLPRSSYGSEFNLLLWLYYFFTPKTAYIVNEILIHVIAFFSMFIFSKRYLAPYTELYGNVPAFVGSLYFAILPFWSGSGASLALLPLATYILLNFYIGKAGKFDWVLLIIIPFYSDFVFIFIFYIALAGIFWIYDSIKYQRINRTFTLALLVFFIIYILKNYRLIELFIFHDGFISHRTEFNVFFKENLWETYRRALVNFLECHVPHAQTLTDYVLPVILISMLLLLFKRKLTVKESLLIWGLIAFSLWTDLWNIILINRYTLPGITLFSLFLLFYNKKEKALPLTMLLIIAISFLGVAQMYAGFRPIAEIFPLLKELNIRVYFILPFLYAVALVYSAKIYFKTLHFSGLFIFIFILFQFHLSLNKSFYSTTYRPDYASFEDYYAPKLFEKMKQDMRNRGLQNGRFVSYGMEPAVALYNGLYTVDGYSTNFPLSYKHKFAKTFKNYLYPDVYRSWGSKLYLLTVPSTIDKFLLIRGTVIQKLRFDTQALRDLNTSYIISPYLFAHPEDKELKFINKYKGGEHSWDLYLYKIKKKISPIPQHEKQTKEHY
jgi:hypothetical protein